MQVRWALKHHGVAYKVIGYTPLVSLASLIYDEYFVLKVFSTEVWLSLVLTPIH